MFVNWTLILNRYLVHADLILVPLPHPQTLLIVHAQTPRFSQSMLLSKNDVQEDSIFVNHLYGGIGIVRIADQNVALVISAYSMGPETSVVTPFVGKAVLAHLIQNNDSVLVDVGNADVGVFVFGQVEWVLQQRFTPAVRMDVEERIAFSVKASDFCVLVGDHSNKYVHVFG